MKLADCVTQCRAPLVVQDCLTGRVTTLSGAADCAAQVVRCQARFVLADDLTRLCTELAYSRGARNLACADLLRVPAENLWVEWCNEPWQSSLEHYGFPRAGERWQRAGHRGALIRSSPDGRRGILRTLWTGATELDVLVSSAEAYFDFDTPHGEEPQCADQQGELASCVYDHACQGEDVLARCFRFRYERTWSDYYRSAALSRIESEAVWRHALGNIALDIPVLLAFLLLLASRVSLPRRLQTFERLNRARRKTGKTPLLDHIEVRAPVLPEYLAGSRWERQHLRRSPRLHHVRGHLVRRGSTLFWRVPHLRGHARSGVIRTRTVTWTFADTAVGRASPIIAPTHAPTPRVAG